MADVMLQMILLSRQSMQVLPFASVNRSVIMTHTQCTKGHRADSPMAFAHWVAYIYFGFQSALTPMCMHCVQYMHKGVKFYKYSEVFP